jgi:hypothetical protein
LRFSSSASGSHSSIFARKKPRHLVGFIQSGPHERAGVWKDSFEGFAQPDQVGNEWRDIFLGRHATLDELEPGGMRPIDPEQSDFRRAVVIRRPVPVLRSIVGQALKRAVNLGRYECVEPSDDGLWVRRIVVRNERARLQPGMQAREVAVRTLFDLQVFWWQRPFERFLVFFRLVYRLIHVSKQFLEPWRWWWRRLRRPMQLHQCLHPGIERGVHLRAVGKETTSRRERTRVAPAIAVIEDADDEAVSNIHDDLAAPWSNCRARTLARGTETACAKTFANR